MEHAQLHLYLSMTTPLGWLSRCPTYKEQLKELKEKDIHTYGFLGYPLLQAADILIYKATAVPVGEDQLPHIELTREIARRFNSLYCKEKPLFPEPQPLLTHIPKIPGTDGRKMSKSYNNAIYLSDERALLEQKIMTMFTSPEKIKIDDPGDPSGCVVFAFHEILDDETSARKTMCKSGKLGCVTCKKELLKYLDLKLAPLREKRKKITDSEIEKTLSLGADRASSSAKHTIKAVKSAMKVS
jgi:tryptophanyl-tRNA synthetase